MTQSAKKREGQDKLFRSPGAENHWEMQWVNFVYFFVKNKKVLFCLNAFSARDVTIVQNKENSSHLERIAMMLFLTVAAMWLGIQVSDQKFVSLNPRKPREPLLSL